MPYRTMQDAYGAEWVGRDDYDQALRERDEALRDRDEAQAELRRVEKDLQVVRRDVAELTGEREAAREKVRFRDILIEQAGKRELKALRERDEALAEVGDWRSVAAHIAKIHRERDEARAVAREAVLNHNDSIKVSCWLHRHNWLLCSEGEGR